MRSKSTKKTVACKIEKDVVQAIRSVAHLTRRDIGTVLADSFEEYCRKHYGDIKLPDPPDNLKRGPVTCPTILYRRKPKIEERPWDV